jgi:hypothetical protein
VEVVVSAAGRKKRRVDSLDMNAAILRVARGWMNYTPQNRFRPI